MLSLAYQKAFEAFKQATEKKMQQFNAMQEKQNSDIKK
jgi:hypothetical protein